MKKTIAALAVFAALSASAQAQTTPPRNCHDLYRRGLFTVDGEYTIQPGDTPFQVYCASTLPEGGWPVDYLTLVNTGGDYNFGQYTAGGWVGGTDARTSYTRVRFDPSSMLIDISDLRFATSNGGNVAYGPGVTTMPLGVAMDCSGYQGATGVANIDLTGTPFEIDDIFYVHGMASAGSVTFNGQTIQLPPDQQAVAVRRTKAVTVRGGGVCGAAGPEGFNSTLHFWPNNLRTMLALKVRLSSR